MEGITNADVMRIRLRVNGTAARTLIDTRAVFSFVAKQFVQDARIPIIRADTPLRVDLAGTGVIRHLTAYAVLQVDATSPMTKARTYPVFQFSSVIFNSISLTYAGGALCGPSELTQLHAVCHRAVSICLAGHESILRRNFPRDLVLCVYSA